MFVDCFCKLYARTYVFIGYLRFHPFSGPLDFFDVIWR